MTCTSRSAMAVLMAALLASSACRGRADRQTPASLRAEIAALSAEREALRARVNALVQKDTRLASMPAAPVVVGVPTSLASDLVQRVIAGFVDQVTLTLRDIKVRKQGTVKRVVTLGAYDLKVTVDRVTGRLKTGKPKVTFGKNRVALALPVTLASGTGRATIDFTWDGRNIGGAVCGDMAVTQAVTGGVRPVTYPLSGSLLFVVNGNAIVARPRLPRMQVHLKVVPSEVSLQAVQKILDDKRGLCGFVLDRVDIMGLVKTTIDKGFDVRIPTDKLKAVDIPVGVEPTLEVRGKPVALAIRIGELTIGEQMIWLGADVSVAVGGGAAPPPPPVTSARSR